MRCTWFRQKAEDHSIELFASGRSGGGASRHHFPLPFAESGACERAQRECLCGGPHSLRGKGRFSRCLKNASSARLTALQGEFDRSCDQDSAWPSPYSRNLRSKSHFPFRTTPSRPSASLYGSCSFFPRPSFSPFLFPFFPFFHDRKLKIGTKMLCAATKFLP